MRLIILLISTYAIAGTALFGSIVIFELLSPHVSDPQALKLIIGITMFFIGMSSRRIAEKCLGISMLEELNRKGPPPEDLE